MKTKALEREKAILLRRAGKSMRAISKELGVSKSSVSVWCRDVVLSPQRVKELMSRANAPQRGALANKIKRQKEVEAIRRQAKKEMRPLDLADLIRLNDLGTALYWAEGGKKYSVDFTNSNPEMIKLIMLWFRTVCQVPEHKFTIRVYYHAGQDEEAMKRYWSQVTNLPLLSFRKSIFKHEGTGHRKNILYNGTCKLVICDKNLLHRILIWIEQLHLPIRT